MTLVKITQNWNYPEKKALCFTGHRPEKIQGVNKKSASAPKHIKNFLTENIEKSINDGYEVFYTGLAKGVDLWAADIVLKYKKEFPEICLIGIQPYPTHGKYFSAPYDTLFKKIYDNSDLILCTSEIYHKGTFLIRDRFMVDHSSKVIGVCNMSDKKSGTYYTLSYAKENNKQIELLSL